MKVSVIIPHANEPSLLLRLLQSIESQTFCESLEVIVVCNPQEKYSNPPSWSFRYNLRWSSSPAGANAARQRGVELAKGDILLFLDDDCELIQKDFIERHFHLLTQSDVAGIGGAYAVRGPRTLYGEVYHHLQKSWIRSHRRPHGYHLHLLGGNSSFKKSVFSKAHFDTNIVFGGTETELQLQLFYLGEKLRYIPDLTVGHNGQLTMTAFLKKSFKQGVGAGYIEKKHSRPARFLFSDENELQPSPSPFLEWVYKASFSAGRKRFHQDSKTQFSNAIIYRSIAAQILRHFFSKDFFFWRNVKNLSRVISLRLLT